MFFLKENSLKARACVKEISSKLEKPQDIFFFKKSCPAIEWNGHSSVPCELNEPNRAYTPEIQSSLFFLNEQLMLLQVILYQGKKFYNWLWDSTANHSSSQAITMISITEEQKERWKTSLVDIEKRLTDLNKQGIGRKKLSWAWFIIEDRKEELRQLKQEVEVNLERVNALTENLAALQTEVEMITLSAPAITNQEETLSVPGQNPNANERASSSFFFTATREKNTHEKREQHEILSTAYLINCLPQLSANLARGNISNSLKFLRAPLVNPSTRCPQTAMVTQVVSMDKTLHA